MKRWYNYPKYKAFDVCRFCNHTAVLHVEIKDFGTVDHRVRWHKCDVPKTPHHCECPGFAPVDNLEYLEDTVKDE